MLSPFSAVVSAISLTPGQRFQTRLNYIKDAAVWRAEEFPYAVA